MEVAANLVSLIQFTILGLNIIQKAFSSVKDSPDTVAYVAKRASDLLHILQQLKNSPTVAQSQDPRLKELMVECRADVSRMAKKLDGVSFDATDKIAAKLWRSAKSVVKEKEWKEFQAKMHEYSASLRTFIAIEDSGKLFNVNNKIDTGHESIFERLATLSAKCDGIDAKCTQIGATASSPQLQVDLDAIRQAIQDQMQLFTRQEEARVPQLDSASGGTGHLEPRITRTHLDATGPTRNGRRSPSPRSRSAKHGEGSASDPVSEVVEEIALLVESVRSLVAETSQMNTKAEMAQTLSEWQSPRDDRDMVFYREIRIGSGFSPGDSPRARSETSDARAASRPLSPSPSPLGRSPHPTHRDPSATSHWTKEEVSESSLCLEEFFSRDSVRPSRTALKPAIVNRATHARLVKWSRADSEPQNLWLQGRYTLARGGENPMTRIGLELVRQAALSEVAVVSYFCQIGATSRARLGDPVGVERYTSLLYALVHETAGLLPSRFEQNHDFSQERFRQLDGTKGSWEVALALLSDLMPLIDRPLYYILDGLHSLEHNSTNEHLRMLAETLVRGPANILFITTGTCPVLRDVIVRVEMLTEEDLRTGHANQDLRRHEQDLWK